MPWAEGGRAGTVLTLGIAGVLLYAASRTAAMALAGRGTARPGWRAVGHWVPIAATALVAAARGRPDVAVSLAFATGVCCLAFVLGVVTYLAPMDELPPTRRGWPFLLPGALLALIAGFSGHLSWIHATALALLGFAVASVWRHPGPTVATDPPPSSPFADAPAVHSMTDAPWFRAAEFVLAVALAVVGGWYALDGVVRAAGSARLFPPSTITVVILSPLVTLPMLNPTAPDTPRDQTASTTSTLVAVALLNLCALLPLLTLLWHVKTALAAEPGAGYVEAAKPLPYPLVAWRVDAVVLTVLGFMFVPVSLGRWELRKAEAFGLILGYAVYLVLVAIASLRV